MEEEPLYNRPRIAIDHFHPIGTRRSRESSRNHTSEFHIEGRETDSEKNQSRALLDIHHSCPCLEPVARPGLSVGSVGLRNRL